MFRSYGAWLCNCIYYSINILPRWGFLFNNSSFLLTLRLYRALNVAFSFFKLN